MVRTNPDGRTHGRTHIQRTKIVTAMSRLPASGLDKNHDFRGRWDAVCRIADLQTAQYDKFAASPNNAFLTFWMNGLRFYVLFNSISVISGGALR